MIEEKYNPPKELTRFQVSIEEGNELKIIRIEDKSSERIGYKTYQLIEVRHIARYPEVVDLKSKQQFPNGVES